MERTKPRVLVVDDAPENILVMTSILKNDYIVQMATSGATALRNLATGPLPSIILLDIEMPDMDGYTLCKTLKANPKTAHIPVIFVTSHADAESETKGLALGAADYLHKPCNPSIVLMRIKTQIENSLYRQNLHSLVVERTHEILLTQKVTIRALATMAEWRDPETGEHIQRTADYVQCIAQKLAESPEYMHRLNPDMIKLLHDSAPLHDIGKVSIPDNILFKAGLLNATERSLMRQHTTFGASIFSKIEESLNNSFFKIAKEIAHSHHEFWNGEGYPQGLRGMDIPLSAQIMAVADVYDALRSKRVYKAAMPHEEAMQQMLLSRSVQFAPDVLDAAVEMQVELRSIAERSLAWDNNHNL